MLWLFVSVLTLNLMEEVDILCVSVVSKILQSVYFVCVCIIEHTNIV